MSTYAADTVRMAALELKQRLLSLEVSLAPVRHTVTGWTLNSYDSVLPMPFDVRVALESYHSLKLERLRLDKDVEKLLEAKVEDVIAVITSPEPATFNGGATFG